MPLDRKTELWIEGNELKTDMGESSGLREEVPRKENAIKTITITIYLKLLPSPEGLISQFKSSTQPIQ